MEGETEKIKKRDVTESVSGDSASESRECSRSTSCDSRSSSDNSSSAQFGWPIRKAANCLRNGVCEGKSKPPLKVEGVGHESKLKKQGSKPSELEMMKERFAKLLLGEDMSGSGKGVCPALTISNAITNLCATVFGQLWRLEPLPSGKKSMWQREMGWLLSVSDHIVEMKPSWQTYPDGKKLEVMTCRPRSDLVIHLPALRKLDNMLLEILDGFTYTEFWYVDQGIGAPDSDGSVSLQKAIQREEDKWWLPVPRVPHGGLPDETRKQLSHKRECVNQILKAATTINNIAISDMEVPESYLETLPKNGRSCLGDVIYRYITSENFSADCLLDCLDISSEHAALEMANRVEAAIYVWRRRQQLKLPAHHSSTKSSWEIVKDLMVNGEKRELVLAERAETLLLSLKQRFPGLTQTTLDATKIQSNKDVGKSILESYSRVLESLAFSIVARIEDLLYVDDINRQSDKMSSLSLISHKKVPVPYSVPLSGTPYRSAYTTPNFSPSPALASPSRGERTPFLKGNCNNGKPARRGMGVKRVLNNYLSSGHVLDSPASSVSNRNSEGMSRLSVEGKESISVRKESRTQQMDR